MGVCKICDREGNTMIYRDFQGIQLSMLGFGTMRFPVLEDG